MIYSFMGMPRIIYKIIKIFQHVVIIILLFYVILYGNSTTKFQYRLLNETHAHGTLGHAIEHGQVKGSHMTLNIQHKSSFKLH